MATANLVEQIKQQTVSLTFAEKQDLANFLAEQLRRENDSHKSANGGAVEIDKRRQREQVWLAEHRAEFAGQWVALDGDRLLSHGVDGRKVYAEARAKGVKVPFVVHLETLDELPFGGW